MAQLLTVVVALSNPVSGPTVSSVTAWMLLPLCLPLSQSVLVC